MAILIKSLNLKNILKIIGTDLKVQYSAGFGMDGLVGMALNMVRDKIPAGLLEELSDNVLLVHLDKIDKIKPVFERLEVKDINMLAEALELVGDFK